MENYRTGPHTRYDIKYHFVASSGNVTDEAIMAYIRQQEGVEPGDGGDNFQVVQS